MNKVIKSMVAIVLAVTMMFSGAVSAFALDLPSVKTAAALLENKEVLTAVVKGEYSEDELKDAAICAVDTTFNTDIVETLKALEWVLNAELPEVKAALEGLKEVLEAELELVEHPIFGNFFPEGKAEEIKEKIEAIKAAIDAIDAVEGIKDLDIAGKVEAKLEALKADIANADWSAVKADLEALKEQLVDVEELKVELEKLEVALNKVAEVDWEKVIADIEADLVALAAELKKAGVEVEIPEIEMPKFDDSELKEMIAKVEEALKSGDVEASVEALKALVKDVDGTVAALIINFCKHLTKECACFPKEDVKVLLGDVDGDGDIDNIDAMYTLQYFVGIEPACDFIEAAADVDVDGDIDNVDAMFILQKFVGIPTVF